LQYLGTMLSATASGLESTNIACLKPPDKTGICHNHRRPIAYEIYT